MSIYVNQVGYYPKMTKHATVTRPGKYTIKGQNDDEFLTVSIDKASFGYDANSGDEVAVLDFSSLQETGTYYITSDMGDESCRFAIKDQVYDNLLRDSMRMFYFQRCGCQLEKKYAGEYEHGPCHMGPMSLLRDRSKSLDCRGGWHDAGDFGKYVTAGAVALAHLLYGYELVPEAFRENLNIPESGNGIDDILNECRYELEWILTMQNEEGGVYHKCTSIRHQDFRMPEDDDLPFFCTPVSSMAVADFVGICYLAARVYKEADRVFADRLAKAADLSWQWLMANPDFLYDNDPSCTTGEYDDVSDLDERMWASAERYRATKDQEALDYLKKQLVYRIDTTSLGWADVGGFAALCVFGAPKDCFDSDVVSRFEADWSDEASRILAVSRSNHYELGMRPHEFIWGSNMEVLKYAAVLLIEGRRKGDEAYIEAGRYQLDYILGRNALDISYVTGYGEHAFKNPHNRPTHCDGVDLPIPGYVAGGPDGHPCDEEAMKLIREGTPAMKCYVDNVWCYSLNEITIYWNSIFVMALALAR